ncbi:MAG: HAMP domain-containing sensor histidine kinase [Candidatus Omnitrophota bacterium]
MENIATQEGLIERISWLIKLRWLAIPGVIFVVFLTTQVFKLSLPLQPLLLVSLILCVYNLIFLFFARKLRKQYSAKNFLLANRIANLQISLDLAFLTTLIHFSGGIENPFIFYFIFHIIIASILLSRRASYLQATFAVGLFVFTVAGEYFGVLPHYCLKGFTTYSQHNNILYILGVSFVFISTLYIAAYMATSISTRLREREEKLRQANALLNEKDRIKSEYVLRVSHDIKEHLSSIQSCLEPVTGGITGTLNPGQSDLLSRADERTHKLMTFVRALLEITRLKLSQKMEMGYFSLRKTVESAVKFVEARAKNKGIPVYLEIEPGIDTIWGAEVYIEETIANLLANAVKYTPYAGKIELSLQDKDDAVLIRISDTGIGIPPEDTERVFDEFYRSSNAKEVERSGTGLGLSIAKQVVRMHKGNIWVESALNKGSTFNILLPKGGKKQ